MLGGRVSTEGYYVRLHLLMGVGRGRFAATDGNGLLIGKKNQDYRIQEEGEEEDSDDSRG
ncbi:hypothetical protein LR48_Vigan09g051100 [Vigna angularis]|uniref:Uncharacterized protein n=1 Tax=Phaseolus angularis TaxID=3914 RepID=A0A0L9VA99_PHAAN|nr:hypothetical protein LR48_Vigan09g051100 [Vigna angularis]